MTETQEEINEQWTEAAENYDGIIQDDLESFRAENRKN